MALIVDAAGKRTANPKTGKVFGGDKKKATSVSAVPSTKPEPQWQQNANVASASNQLMTSAPIGVASSPGVATKVAKPVSLNDVTDSVLPEFGADESTNSMYENYFKQLGMSDDDIEDIRSRGSWFDIHLNNPVTRLATDNLGSNPWLNMSIDDLKEDVDSNIESLRTTGNFRPVEMPINPDNSTSIGNPYVVDTGHNLDYDHLTADKVTGSAMQRYGELGMGGRDWWEYDPYATYTKSDERKNGFVPYLPDQTSRGNLASSQILDQPSDLAGSLAKSRELMTDYTINLDRDGDWSTNDNDLVRLSGSDWDYRATPYINNMKKLLAYEPQTFLSMPKDGKVHGAPVTTMVLEHAMPDVDGSTRYLYGELLNEDAEGNPLSYYNEDNSLHLTFSDGQTVDVPESVYSEWIDQNGEIYIPDAPRVPVEEARGFLPDDLDSLNENVRKNLNSDSIMNAPVLYLPDLVMDDGTRVTWDQATRVYDDRNADDTSDGISYDFGSAGFSKPRRLTGDIITDEGRLNLEDMLNNAYDFTAGSLPISFDMIAWPYSISQALSKSAAGIDPNKYDALTGSDRYISAELDENGEMVPSYSDLQQIANVAGNALVPLTEQLAGPISGHSAIEALSGKLPANPTKWQILKNFGLGAMGEGMEEVAGNLFEGLTDQGEAAFGDVVTPEGERLLDDNGQPVTDEYGNYRFVDANGDPYTYMTDEMGHIYQDRHTPMSSRVRNFLNLNDLANAFGGGVLVDATMQGIPLLRNLSGAARRDAIRRQTGLPQYVDTDRDRMRAEGAYVDPTSGDIQIDPRYLSLFDSRVRNDEE